MLQLGGIWCYNIVYAEKKAWNTKGSSVYDCFEPFSNL